MKIISYLHSAAPNTLLLSNKRKPNSDERRSEESGAWVYSDIMVHTDFDYNEEMVRCVVEIAEKKVEMALWIFKH